MPGAEAQLDEYWAAADCLAAAGFTHYEISNWARPGFACRHNLAGWEYRPYLGCGAGAHSMFRLGDGSTERSWNVKGPHAYIRRGHFAGRAGGSSGDLSPKRGGGGAAV